MRVYALRAVQSIFDIAGRKGYNQHIAEFTEYPGSEERIQAALQGICGFVMTAQTLTTETKYLKRIKAEFLKLKANE